MRKRIIAGCTFSLCFLLNAAVAQPTVSFINTGPGWAGPWYAGGTNQAFATDSSPQVALFGNSLLAGTGFTAELWGGPENITSIWELQPLQRTTFRTGALAGTCALPLSPAAVPFAQPGQRIAYQLRVWDNRAGTIPTWVQVLVNPSGIVSGMSEIYLSPPLSSDTTTLEIRDGYALSIDHPTLRLPVVSITTDGVHKFLNRGIYAGQNVTLTVECPNPLATAQWSFRGTNLPNQTNPVLSLPDFGSSQTGLYSAAVTTMIGTRVATMSNSATLSLLSPPLPRIGQPQLDPQQGFRAVIEGVTNRSVQIDITSNLVSWTPWHTQYVGFDPNPFCVCLRNSFTNSFPLPAPARFYRARLLP